MPQPSLHVVVSAEPFPKRKILRESAAFADDFAMVEVEEEVLFIMVSAFAFEAKRVKTFPLAQK